MTHRIEEWVEKAEKDFVSAAREITAQENANHDLVCFLCQQCAEKYLKATLVRLEQTVPRTHDLGGLMELLVNDVPDYERHWNRLELLSSRAVDVRYPGYTAELDEAHEALETAREFRHAARKILGLE